LPATDTAPRTVLRRLAAIDEQGYVWLDGGVAARVLAGVRASDLRDAHASGHPVLVLDDGDHPVVLGVVHERADDGRVLVLTASQGLRLACGGASIELTADGRIRMQGAHLHQRCAGLVRISGAQVRIN
jgi:hypothetical protein